MSITSIRDILQSFAQSLKISTIFPASLFVMTNIYYILPMFVNFGTDDNVIIFIATSSSLMLSYLLYAFNFPIIRLLEGYKLRNSWPLRKMEAYQRSRLQDIVDRISMLDRAKVQIRNELGLRSSEKPTPTHGPYYECWLQVEYELAVLHQRKDSCFPSKFAAVLPTELGNVIAAFEDYPRNRYGIDTVSFWPRLVPILKKTGFLDFIAEEKTVFDFVLNTTLAVGIIGLELFYAHLFLTQIISAIIWLFFMALLVIVLHAGLVIAARQWGMTVRVAFDLHRHKLHRELGLIPQPTFEADFEQWRRVSSFISYQQNSAKFYDFYPSAQIDDTATMADVC